MIHVMSKVSSNEPINSKKPPGLWWSILLLTIFICLMVGLFGALVYLFTTGAQQMGLPSFTYVIIFVGLSGIFAWLVKRITAIVAGMSQEWFPEDSNHEN
jgi:hypothetical protein